MANKIDVKYSSHSARGVETRSDEKEGRRTWLVVAQLTERRES